MIIFLKDVVILLVALVGLKFTTFEMTVFFVMLVSMLIDEILSGVLAGGIILDYVFGGVINDAFRPILFIIPLALLALPESHTQPRLTHSSR